MRRERLVNRERYKIRHNTPNGLGAEKRVSMGIKRNEKEEN